MSRISSKLCLALVVCLFSSTIAIAQTSTGAIAHVYVASNSGNNNQIYAYSVLPNGALRPVSGSPFPDNVFYVAANQHWLFGIDSSGTNIESYAIAADGSLSARQTYHVTQTGGTVVNLFLDHTGSSLYSDFYTENNEYLEYEVNQSTGQLSYLSGLSGGTDIGTPLAFIGNNQFAYSSSCYHGDPDIYGVERASNGILSFLNISPPLPEPPPGYIYCPFSAAADPTNHLAIAVQASQDMGQYGPYQLASYTADSSGNLTTNSTYQNMPSVLVGTVYDYRMSASGQYLAVGGSSGFQLFHFNGANPVSSFTGLLTSDPIEHTFWDNANHVFGISHEANKLYVFTVTANGATPAPGSPYSISMPQSLVVLPKPSVQ